MHVNQQNADLQAGTEQAALQAQQSPMPDESTPPSPPPFFSGMVFQILLCLLLSISCILVYHILFYRVPMRVAVADIDMVLEASELMLYERLTRNNIPPEERDAIFMQARTVGPRLQQVVDEIQQECNCILLARPAALSMDGVEDFTPRLAEAIGVASADVETIRLMLENRTNERVKNAITPDTEATESRLPQFP